MATTKTQPIINVKPKKGGGGPTTQQRKDLGRNLSRVANQKKG